METASRLQTKVEPGKIWTRDFFLICMANFFVFLSFQMTLPTIPLFVKELGGGDQLVGAVVGIFTFSALLIRPFAGHALESKGRGFVYLLGLSIFILSIGTYALVASIVFLFIMRIVQGVGWGFATTAGGTIATDIIPANRRGEGLGYFGLSGNIALAFGPSLGLTLAGVISFSQLFTICTVIAVLAILLASKIHYKKVEKLEEKTTTLKLDIFEKSAIEPSILLLFITVTFGGIATFLPLHTIEKGITGIQLYFLVFAIFLMISRTFAGRLYDKKGHQYIFLPGALLIFFAMILLAWLPNTGVLLIAAAMYGLGFGSVQPALQAWAVEKALSNRKGMANATFFSSFDLGVGIGAIAFGQIAFLGYEMIYFASAGSVMVSVFMYLYLFIRAKRMVQ
ncbi:MFS transporter [Oceanobacillus bengalensis]|uniref:MFS transporter n=1 Tax=Oceanobacillus bengalensis TaxID=1435466 RepID=A0A494Z0F8_9BACI|nr:MFS transporter [Oceanobacillus bengalensis]RKQ15841.1 MFS transporter [Oceanobacillus bengalensis]